MMRPMMHIYWLLQAYWRARRMRFASREALEQHQQQGLARWQRYVCQHSPHFAALRHLPLAQWPLMDKARMMAHFDTMNTVGLHRDAVMALALQAEHSRDFSPTVGGFTVGLSSGTTGQRGCFVVSAQEKAAWAGTVLAKALPDGLLAGERVALFLRANSNLYTAVNHHWLTLQFFDLFAPFSQHLQAVREYAPSIIVAPAQVLRALALAQLEGQLTLAPKRVISVAEVLEPHDRALITQAFGAPHEIYQATEGFLASTCAHGVLHLHEEYIHVEPEWLDAQRTRFVPIITDFSRRTQPIARYRLNDVLRVRRTPCPCGQVTLALDGIEGRCDDMLQLPDMHGHAVPVFADVLSRCLAQSLPLQADYQLEQNGPVALELSAQVAPELIATIQHKLEDCLRGLGVNVAALHWQLYTTLPASLPTQKRRRIVRHAARRAVPHDASNANHHTHEEPACVY
jgi:putative adenylate-forming enzyme